MVVRKDGKVRWQLINGTPIYNSRGEIIASYLILTDITDRKQSEVTLLKSTEELHAAYEELTASQDELSSNLDILTRQELALRESKRGLADIIEFLPDATFVIDRQGIVIAWNRAMEEMTGVSKDEMIGQGDHAYTIPFYGERRKQLLDLIDMDDEELQAKYQYVTRKGNTLYAETFTPALYGGKGAYVWATGSPLFDDCANRIGAIESIRDISEWELADSALHESEQKYRDIFENSVMGLFKTSPDGAVLCNKTLIIYFIIIINTLY
jgi:PAS domain S-box-containing protein